MQSSAKEQNSRKHWAELPPFIPDPCPWVASVPAWFCGISTHGVIQKSTGHGPQAAWSDFGVGLSLGEWDETLPLDIIPWFCIHPLMAGVFLLLLHLHPKLCMCAHGLERIWGKGRMRVQDKKTECCTVNEYCSWGKVAYFLLKPYSLIRRGSRVAFSCARELKCLA